MPFVLRPILEFEGVTRAYGPRLALDDVNLALEPGELAFLVGPSGAGKTTLLKLINREIRPTKGAVWVDGISAHNLKTARVSELRRRVGVVFQDFKLLPRLTALENVAFALQVGDLRVSDQEASERALDALDAVGLGDRGGSFPHQRSGGQQQRIAVARAVVAHQAALHQGQHATLKTPHDLDVVSRDEHGGAEGGDVGEEIHHLPGRFKVEVAGRLVGDQKRRLRDHRPRHSDALLLPARELVRKRTAAVA